MNEGFSEIKINVKRAILHTYISVRKVYMNPKKLFPYFLTRPPFPAYHNIWSFWNDF